MKTNDISQNDDLERGGILEANVKAQIREQQNSEIETKSHRALSAAPCSHSASLDSDVRGMSPSELPSYLAQFEDEESRELAYSKYLHCNHSKDTQCGDAHQPQSTVLQKSVLETFHMNQVKMGFGEDDGFTKSWMLQAAV